MTMKAELTMVSQDAAATVPDRFSGGFQEDRKELQAGQPAVGNTFRRVSTRLLSRPARLAAMLSALFTCSIVAYIWTTFS